MDTKEEKIDNRTAPSPVENDDVSEYKPSRIPANSRFRHFLEWAYSHLFLIILFIVLAIAGVIVTIIVSPHNIKIGMSIIRDINITLISTMATLLGLYVTAFIFLNDSLKNRMRDDTALKGPINAIISDGRREMILFSVFTIVAILYEVIINVLLGKLNGNANDNSVEDLILKIGDRDWIFFLSGAIVSVVVITAIIIASRQIMNSEKLIDEKIHKKLSDSSKALEKIIPSSEVSEPQATFALLDLVDLIKQGSEVTHDAFLETIRKKRYSLEKKFFAIKKHTAAPNTCDDYRVQLAKSVRLLDVILSKICDNNIDKSIMSSEDVIDGMRSGFLWLFSKASNESKDPGNDIREQNRFYDFLKHQMMLEVLEKQKQNFSNAFLEEVFTLLKRYCSALQLNPDSNKTLTEAINIYRCRLRSLINAFFDGYKPLVSFRDAFAHIDITPNSKEERDLLKNAQKVLAYANTLTRVLIDLFTLFVKINDLNLGYSAFDLGWFNYSDMSKSSLTHSSFRLARIENAILQSCDLSICDFTDADVSGTDFTKSNFSYSNLTGVDFTDCVLNKAQMDNVRLRNPIWDNYDNAELLKRFPTLELEKLATYKAWKKRATPDSVAKTLKPDHSLDPEIFLAYSAPDGDYFAIRKGAVLSPDLFTDGKIPFSVAILHDASLNNVTFSATDLSHVEMDRAAARESDLSESQMYYTKASKAMFFRTNLNQLDAYASDYNGANFSEATLIGAVFADCDIVSCNFEKALLLNAEIIYPTTISPDHSPCDASSAPAEEISIADRYSILYDDEPKREGLPKTKHLKRFRSNSWPSKSSDCNFKEAIADKIVILNANMNRALFKQATLRDCLIFNTLLWWSNFEKANLSHSNIFGVSFNRSALVETSFVRSRIDATDFTGANLNSSAFVFCTLQDVIFDEANLNSCNISSATFENCVFSRCTMEKTIMMDTVFRNVIFEQIDFTKVIGLESVTFEDCVFILPDNCSGYLLKEEDYYLEGPDKISVHLIRQNSPVGEIPPKYTVDRLSNV